MIQHQTEELLSGIVEDAKALLGENLVGVYLHGSLVMGCFNPQKSDVDLIVVVEAPPSDAVKRAFLETVVAYNAKGPAKGVEMSVVLRKVCRPFVYPTPYELHFSAGHLQSWQADPDAYIRRMKGVDKDLAAHFTMINKRGRCLCGAPIGEVFAEVPREAYLESLLYDVEDAVEEITAYPMYLTLNLARVLAWREAGLVLSKREGGQWALEQLPPEYRPLIRDALREYSETAEPVYDEVLARRYAKYALDRITQGKRFC